MGTSQAIKPGVKYDQDWNKLSRQISTMLQQGSTDNSRSIDIVKHLNACLRKSRSSGKPTGYSSAADRFSGFLGLVFAIQSSGMNDFVAGHTQERLDTIEKSIQLFVSYLSKNAATLYDVAANDAMKQVIERLLSDCDDVEEVEAVMNGLNEEKLRFVFIEFIANFVIEVVDQLFNEKYGIGADAQRRQLINDVRDYVYEDLKCNLKADVHIRKIMQDKAHAKSYVDTLIKEVMEIWS